MLTTVLLTVGFLLLSTHSLIQTWINKNNRRRLDSLEFGLKVKQRRIFEAEQRITELEQRERVRDQAACAGDVVSIGTDASRFGIKGGNVIGGTVKGDVPVRMAVDFERAMDHFGEMSDSDETNELQPAAFPPEPDCDDDLDLEDEDTAILPVDDDR